MLNTRFRPVLLAGIALLIAAAPSYAQVSVAPTALFLSQQERFGAMYVSNPSSTPQEVTVGFRFGYTTSDSTGSVYVEYSDSTTAKKHSIAPYVRAFPQRFILPPGETQVVRLTARPPSELQEKWLWSRVITTSSPQVSFPDTTEEGVSARVLFRLQQVTALFYTQGEASADVQIRSMTTAIDSNEVVILADLEKSGDRPYFGRAVLSLKDSDGRVVGEEMTLVALYKNDRRRFVVELPEDSPPGSTLSAELAISTERSDIPVEYLLKSPLVSSSASVRDSQ